MDATSWLDLVDFWNLRALGGFVLPLPKQWAKNLTDDVSEVIAQHYVPYRHNRTMFHSTSLVCSPRWDEKYAARSIMSLPERAFTCSAMMGFLRLPFL